MIKVHITWFICFAYCLVILNIIQYYIIGIVLFYICWRSFIQGTIWHYNLYYKWQRNGLSVCVCMNWLDTSRHVRNLKFCMEIETNLRSSIKLWNSNICEIQYKIIADYHFAIINYKFMKYNIRIIYILLYEINPLDF